MIKLKLEKDGEWTPDEKMVLSEMNEAALNAEDWLNLLVGMLEETTALQATVRVEPSLEVIYTWQLNEGMSQEQADELAAHLLKKKGFLQKGFDK